VDGVSRQKQVTLTVFLGHICISKPRRVFRDIEEISYNRPRGRPRRITESSSAGVVTKSEEKVDEPRDGEAVSQRDEREWHDCTRLSVRLRVEGLYMTD
jgi:hypothetical protein